MRALTILFFSLFVTLTFGQIKNNSTGFIENKGQIVDQKSKPNAAVKYLLNTNGLNVQLREKGFSYDVYETEKTPLTKKDKAFHSSNLNLDKEKETPDYSLKHNFHRIDIDFLNANQNVKLIAEEKSKDYDNYYNVAHDRNGITNVHKYKKVTYQNIYNKIDVVFFIPNDSTKAVEYNFIVKPGGKISDIQLKIDGGKTELVENKIRMQLRFGEMEETIPMSWTEQGNRKSEINISYKKIKKNVYGFEGDLKFSEKTIVIDPTPIRLWGTYYGGSNGEVPRNITNDNLNDIYVSGTSTSQTNIATIGTFQGTFLSDYNSFLTKFNSNGIRIWGTYYGTLPEKLTTDSNQNIYAIHNIFSTNLVLTTPNSHQPVKNIYHDTYLVKFNSSGIREWATYYGGEQNDYGYDLVCDNLDNIYICGQTSSINNISTSNSYQSTLDSPLLADGFIVKFNENGVRQWGTYYGGIGGDGFTGISFHQNFLYLVGKTTSSNNISTPNVYSSNYTNPDIMIVKFDTNGDRIWGTYFGGNNDERNLYSVLKNDNIYIYGVTNSINGIGTIGTFMPNYETINSNGYYNDDAFFIVKFNYVNQSFEWGTYFNGVIQDFSVDSFENVYLSGYTDRNTGISTPNTYLTSKLGNQKPFLVKLNNFGEKEWGTYVGGDGVDYQARMTLDNNNAIYVCGITTSTTGISTPNTHQVNYNSGGDIFINKFFDCQLSSLANSNSPICIGSNLELTSSGGTNYSWTGPNGYTSTDQNPIIPNANTSHSGQYTCAITGTGGCDNTVSLNVVVGDSATPIPTITNLPIITGDCNTVISTIPTALDNCSGTINATTTNPLTYSIPGNYTITWNYNDGNGNSSSQTQNVTISLVALPTLTSPQQFCIQQNTTLNNITVSGQNIKWYDAASDGNLLPNTTPLQNGITYYASQTINGCESTRVPVFVNIQNTPAPTGNQNQSFCSTENATLNNIIIAETDIIWYNSLSGNTVLPTSTLLQNGVTYYASQTINGCESPTRLAVSIQLINTLNANNYSETLCDDLNNGIETVNLSNYNLLLISATGNIFKFYNSLNGAQNLLTSDEVQNSSNYNLSLGNNLFYVRIESPNTCFQIVTLNLTLVSKPFININDIMPICEESSITVDAGFGYDNYNWSTNETSSSIIISQPGNYSVIVSENHGTLVCSTTKNFTVVNSNIGTISEIITSDWTQNENTISVLLSSNSAGSYEYSLNGIEYQDNNTFYGLENGEYTVFIRDKNGCGVSSEDVYLLMYPKYFTPNGDGYNDYWRIKFSENEPNLMVTIFDRYGKLMTQFDSSSIGWNGTYQDNLMPSTDYWFVVKRENGKEFKGHFTLKR
jgi:gliding motility-associated-like protein